MTQDEMGARLRRFSSRLVAKELALATGIKLTDAAVRAWRVNGVPRWSVKQVEQVLDRLERQEVQKGG